MRFEATRKWLLYTILGVIAFGMVWSVANVAIYFHLMNDSLNLAFWADASVSAQAMEMQRWVFGIFGITIASWGIAILFLVMYPIKERRMWAWNAIAVSMVFWWVLDTAVSAYFGVMINVATNTLLFLAIMLPTLLLRKHMSAPSLIEEPLT